MIYEPAEDSYFLKSFVEDLDLEGKSFLEVGAGKGVIALKAHQKGAEVTASDLDAETVEYLRGNLPDDIEVIKSDLFDQIDGKFDYIVFNPPYLSGERKGKSDPLVGGTKGTGVTEKFLEQVSNYLNEDGTVYVILSSEANPDQLIDKFDLEKIDSKKLWFETLYLMKTW